MRQPMGRELCTGSLTQATAACHHFTVTCCASQRHRPLPQYRLVPTGALSPAAGFLRKKDHEAAYGQGAVLDQGALLECVVMPGSKGCLVKVTTDPEAVAHTVTKDQERLNISKRCTAAEAPTRCRARHTWSV